MSVDNETDVEIMLDISVYINCLLVYTSSRDRSKEKYDFLFTQFEIDEKVRRVEEMRDDCEKRGEKVMTEGAEDSEEDQGIVSFHSDSLNMNFSESDVEITPKKKRRIPPPILHTD